MAKILKCPKCGKKLEILNKQFEPLVFVDVVLDADGNLDEVSDRTFGEHDDDNDLYRCPTCHFCTEYYSVFVENIEE